MTPAQQKTAYRLWKAYKTTGYEYRQLAEALGMQITDLNAEMSRVNQIRQQQKAKAR